MPSSRSGDSWQRPCIRPVVNTQLFLQAFKFEKRAKDINELVSMALNAMVICFFCFSDETVTMR